MDQGLATALAAIATLVVGVAVVIATLITNSRSAKDTFKAQLAIERNRGLMTLIEIAQDQSIHVNDTIFNVAEAGDGGDDRTGDYSRVYGPSRRVLVPVPATHKPKAQALLSVYGVWDIRTAYMSWTSTLANLEDLLETAKFNYMENDAAVTPDFFSVAQFAEAKALSRLGHEVSKEVAKIPTVASSRALRRKR